MHLYPCDMALAEMYDYLSCLKLSTSNFLSVIFISKALKLNLKNFIPVSFYVRFPQGWGQNQVRQG